ncbi:hypothetical protein [Pedobacter sp. L105]|uniref:hypothetical protein n=1 Tax=Pedobacter sp. L105 TaxID=1641871 RepID=UPI00131D8FB5|nr:hypothetical protein [Pedobacter sp. L105]
MSDSSQEFTAQKPLTLQKGRYVCIDDLKEEQNAGSTIPYFSAKAILIVEKERSLTGDIKTVNLSDLILKQSTYMDEGGKAIEAHKLYTWPRNLGSTAAWTAAKQEFLNQFVLNFPIEVLSLQEERGVTWRYITPENFKTFPDDIIATPAFMEFATHRSEYFFLRRPLYSPK